MAKEWYLLKTPHDQVSGYEDEAWDDFAQEGFSEILDTNMAVDIQLYNYDLSVVKNLKGVVSNRVQDTKLQSLSRMLLVPIGTCKSGMYVKYDGHYWLIVNLVDDNGMYEKAIMVICNYLLSWANENNHIIQRWCNITSASQYNNGETNSRFYDVRSDQLLILLPDDDECVLLSTGKRFVIDRRCKVYEKSFDTNTTVNTDNPVIVYRLTRSDSTLYDFGDSGHQEIMVYQDEQRDDDGYYVINGKGYWLCGNPNIVHNINSLSLLSADIVCDTTDIYNGLEPVVFTAQFYDENGGLVSVEPHWSILCDFADELQVQYIGNSICIAVKNKKFINKSFELFLSADGYSTISKTITIKAFI